MNYICGWGILASITGIAIMFSVIKHKKSVSAINPNRSLENDKKLFLMTAIRKTALYMLDS